MTRHVRSALCTHPPIPSPSSFLLLLIVPCVWVIVAGRRSNAKRGVAAEEWEKTEAGEAAAVAPVVVVSEVAGAPVEVTVE